MTYAEIILLCLIAASGIYHILAFVCLVEFFSAKAARPGATPRPSISILKPLKGHDSNLEDNILSFCSQDYPEYEVLLGFTDPQDNALEDARKIASSQSGCSVGVMVSETGRGANRKVANLQGLADAARHDLLVFSDSDMKVGRDYLSTIAAEYSSSENVGLVTSLYKISSPETAGAAFESLTIALDFIPSVLVARKLEGMTFGLGASMLVSRKALEEIGGLSAVADYIADDYQIGNRLWKKGYRIVLSRYVMEDVVGRLSIADYLIHQLRWARTYRASRPKGFFGYGITHLFPISLLYLFLSGTTALSLSVFGAVLVIRLCTALFMSKLVIRSRGWLKWLFMLPGKDMISFVIWAWSFTGRRVFWRGAYYRIEKDGRFSDITLRPKHQ